MDFFAHQDAARRRTRRLVLLFALAVAATVLAVYMAVVIAFREYVTSVWNPALFAIVAASTCSVIAAGSLYKTVALSRGGGEAVAFLLGGKPLVATTTQPGEKRLLNVVEEMAIAAGTAVPSVYMLGEEKSINAFAAGLNRDAAVVGVTRGAVDHLDRAELQGVMGHELSHILNGDMRLNVRLMGLLHGILVISLIGYWILRSGAGSGGGSSSSRKKGGGGIAAFGIALYVIGWIGAFFAGIIKSAISRQRELLADAAAVQFTRNPQGLAAALKKIGGLAAGSRLATPNAPQASHFFFGNGMPESRFAWRSTHPPLAERIRRLDPAWDGTFPRLAEPVETPARSGGAHAAPATARRGAAFELPGMMLPGVGAALPALGTALPMVSASFAPGELVSSAGQPGPQHLEAAAGLLANLPPALADRARDPMAARAVVLALLCDSDPSVRQRQLERVGASGDEPLGRELGSALPAADGLAAEVRLPLVDLAVPALRRLSPAQYRSFRALMDELVRADERLSLFEWTLHRVLLRHLEPWFAPKQTPKVTTYGLQQLGGEVSLLLSTLAHAGADDPTGVAAAFAAGVAALGKAAPAGVRLLERSDCTFGRLDEALTALSRVAPVRLRELLTACAATVAHDGVVRGAEGELLRALADSLGCPVPPLVAAAA